MVFDQNIKIRDCVVFEETFYSETKKSLSTGSELFFDNITFKSFSFYNVKGYTIRFRNSKLESLSIIECKSSFDINNSKIEYIRSLKNTPNTFDIKNCKLGNIGLEKVSGNYTIDNSVFLSNYNDSLIKDSSGKILGDFGDGTLMEINLLVESIDSSLLENNDKIYLSSPLIFFGNNKSELLSLTINNCNTQNEIENQWGVFDADFTNLEINENELPWYFYFGRSQVENRFSFYKNRLTKNVVLDKFLFPGFEKEIDWKSISNRLVGHFKYQQEPRFPITLKYLIPATKYYKYSDAKLYSNENAYNALLKTYKYIYDNYKQRGNTESANACYAEMKQVETRRWKYLFKEDPKFETYFRWKLNQFLN